MLPFTRSGSASIVTASLFIAIGAGLSLFSLLADRFDVGGGEGFGYQQMIVLIIGVVVMLAGLRMLAGPWLNRLSSSSDTDR